jgi:hypothetical protein
VARRVSSPVFIGRAEELAALDTALERAAGDRTQTVLIAGESGVGKTRLLQEFSRSDAARGAQWLSGECIALTEGELPYAPITTVLRSIPGELEDLDLTPESAPELARLVPEMGPLTAADPSDEGTPPFTGGGLAQGRLFEQFLSLLVGLARKDPVCSRWRISTGPIDRRATCFRS